VISIVSLILLPGPWGRKEAAKQLEYAKDHTPTTELHANY